MDQLHDWSEVLKVYKQIGDKVLEQWPVARHHILISNRVATEVLKVYKQIGDNYASGQAPYSYQ